MGVSVAGCDRDEGEQSRGEQIAFSKGIGADSLFDLQATKSTVCKQTCPRAR